MKQVGGHVCKKPPLVEQAAEVDIELVDRGQLAFNSNINT